MSKVSSDKTQSQQYDQISQLKEQFAHHENELVQHHKEQIAHMDQAHEKEIDSLKSSHEEQLKSLRENSKRALAEREAEYTAQIKKYQDAAASSGQKKNNDKI